MPKQRSNIKLIRFRNYIYISLIAVLYVYSLSFGLRNSMHHILPEAINRHLNSMGVAISDLRYGLKGYVGYNKIADALVSEGTTSGPILNTAIKRALNIADPANGGNYYLLTDDKGLAVYYKLAFKIFGFRIESFFYLYYLILGISVLVFILTFYRRPVLLNLLLLFLCAHYVSVGAASVVGIQLGTVHNARFLPVLAILPSLYLALLILGRRRNNLPVFIGAFAQSSILLLIIHARTTTKYAILFLGVIFVCAYLWRWRKYPELRRFIFYRVNFWPLGIAVVLFIGLKLHLLLALSFPYTSASSQHIFWHPMYIGLAAHPQSKAKYGIEFEDFVTAKLVSNRLFKEYGQNISYDTDLSESIIKEEYFKIIKSDPKFAVENYLYKFPMFVKEYLSGPFGATRFIFNWFIVFAVILGSFLSGEIFLREWLGYFLLLFLGCLVSLLPLIIVAPQKHLLADAAVFFTLCIYLFFSFLACILIKFIKNPIRPNIKIQEANNV